MIISAQLDDDSGDFINQANLIIPVISLLIGVILVFIDLEIPEFGKLDFNSDLQEINLNDQ